MLTDGTEIVRVINVEKFDDAQAIVIEQGSRTELSEGPIAITGGQLADSRAE